MAEEGFKRKLAAILSADVEGYSRLMDDNEEATVRTLTSYRTAIADLVQQFRGRIVDTTGDNILSEFTSVVDAVNCAVEIQRDLAERNTELPHNRKMQFRIGVNLGDVIEEEGRIYGDGVNIAARVESMAEAGGICISGRAYDQVENKLGLEYENLGEHQVKNITRPIRVYRVLSLPGAAAHRVMQAKKSVAKKWRNLAIAAGAAVVAVVIASVLWHFYMRPPSVETASVEKRASSPPDKPSLAVLPFANMSDDPEQEYFSDGITEDLITDLSKISGLFVIARNSTFTYKGKPINVQVVARELNKNRVLTVKYLRIAMKHPNSIAYAVSSQIFLFKRQYNEAIVQAEKAVSQEPTSLAAGFALVRALIMSGQPDQALPQIEKLLWLDPINPARALAEYGLALFCLGNLQSAYEYIEKAKKHRISCSSETFAI